MIREITQHVEGSVAVKQRILSDERLLHSVMEAAQASVASIRSGGKLLIAGNGGSAADAQHLAAELTNRFLFERPAIPALALSTDTSALTAIANDRAFEYVFSRQVEALGRAGDSFWGISTSGNSANIVEAMKVCAERDITVVSFTGEKDCAIDTFADYSLKVPSSNTPLIQESHIMIGHILCDLIERSLYGE